MSNHLATVNCEFDQPNGIFVLGTPISGRFWVTPKKDLQYKYIRYAVILKVEAVGGATKYERSAYTAHLVGTTGEWTIPSSSDSKPYEYPFQFSLQHPISYSGAYFRFKWFIQFEVEMTAESRKILRKTAIERLNLQRLIFPSSKIKEQFSFTLKRGGRPFSVLDKKHEIKIDNPTLKYLAPTAIGTVGVIWTWAAHIHMVFPLFDIIGATGLGLGIYQMIVGFGRLGKLEFEVTPSFRKANHFDVKTTIQQNWSRVEKIGVHYQVIEKAAYSDTSKQSKIQYQPKTEIQKNVSAVTTTIQVDFPRREIPPTITYGDYSVVWKLFVTIYLTNGKSKTYNFDFITQL